MARLYANENFPLPVVEELRKLGHDVQTTHDAGQSGLAIPDEEVLAKAAGEQRAVLTFNRLHFIRLHAAKPRHAGIIVCTFDANFYRLAARIHDSIVASPNLAGQLVRVYRPG